MPLSAFDQLFFRVFDKKNYHCTHFVVDTWRLLYGLDVSFLLAPRIPGASHPFSDAKHFHLTTKTPKDKAIALCRTPSNSDLHLGTIHNRRFFHLAEEGVFNLPLDVAFVGFSRVKFYEYY